MKKIIVIGASAASIAFISKLRSFDQSSQIVCFSGEAFLPYNRCFLADFLTGDQNQTELQLKPEDFFQKNNVDLRLNTWVTSINLQKKQVCVGDASFDFDYLFLGMGCRPLVPNFLQNVRPQGVFTFHTLQDIHQIQNYITHYKPKSAVVVGAGLNGIEAASSLIDLNIAVTLVEAAPMVLPGRVDQAISGWMLEKMKQKNVTVVLGQKVVDCVQENDQVQAVILDKGAKVDADIIIIAAGSVVNSDLLEQSGIVMVNRSVIVDNHLKTNFEYVFAAGDLCAVPDMTSKTLQRSTTWSDAMLQGLCAATNLSENPRAYPGYVGLQDSYFFEVDFYACGQTTGFQAPVQVVQKIQDECAQAFYIQNDCLIGFVLIGDSLKLAEYKMWYMTKKLVSASDFN